jgi:hypothetical protein
VVVGGESPFCFEILTPLPPPFFPPPSATHDRNRSTPTPTTTTSQVKATKAADHTLLSLSLSFPLTQLVPRRAGGQAAHVHRALLHVHAAGALCVCMRVHACACGASIR